MKTDLEFPLRYSRWCRGRNSSSFKRRNLQSYLLDGYLELDLERECPDGGVIARKLREGSYGPKIKTQKFYLLVLLREQYL
jgi:hypothetical protein